MQYLRLRMGKVVEDRLFEDTAALVDVLAVLARLGNEEATAPPLGPLPAEGAGIAPAGSKVSAA